jgi:hypothetical protein
MGDPKFQRVPPDPDILPGAAKYACWFCGGANYDSYMLQDQVWHEIMGSSSGFLHLKCLHGALGRPVKITDFRVLGSPEVQFGYALAQAELSGSQNADL